MENEKLPRKGSIARMFVNSWEACGARRHRDLLKMYVGCKLERSGLHPGAELINEKIALDRHGGVMAIGSGWMHIGMTLSGVLRRYGHRLVEGEEGWTKGVVLWRYGQERKMKERPHVGDMVEVNYGGEWKFAKVNRLYNQANEIGFSVNMDGNRYVEVYRGDWRWPQKEEERTPGDVFEQMLDDGVKTADARKIIKERKERDEIEARCKQGKEIHKQVAEHIRKQQLEQIGPPATPPLAPASQRTQDMKKHLDSIAEMHRSKRETYVKLCAIDSFSEWARPLVKKIDESGNLGRSALIALAIEARKLLDDRDINWQVGLS